MGIAEAMILRLVVYAKGKMNGSAALDIRPNGVMLLKRRQPDFLGCRPEQILLYSHLKWCLHGIWDCPHLA